jgi:hypothetical protein
MGIDAKKIVINELSSSLSEGIKLKEKLLDDYKYCPIDLFFLVTDYFSTKRNFNGWKDKALSVINKYLPDSRYAARFAYPPTEIVNLPYVSLGMVRNYYSKYEAHLKALQEIIWNFNENDLRDDEIEKIQINNSSNKVKLEFTADQSIIKTIYNILLRSKGDYVKVKDIAKKIDRKPEYVRIVMDNLNEKILKQNLTNRIKIQTNREGSYMLTFLS